MKKIIVLAFFIFNILLEAQIYPPAVEVWSDPIRLDSLSERFGGEWSPTLTTDLNKLYLLKGSEIAVSYKSDTLWSLPQVLNSNINNGSPIWHPSISKDSNRLYFSRWGGYGSWDLWYSEWDSITNDWGQSVNLGPNVNSSSSDFYAYEISEDTLYCINVVWATYGVCTYVRNSLTGEWEIVDSSNYNHPFGEGNIRGVSVTGDRRKAYFSQYVSIFPDSLQSELYVTFWDTMTNRWGNVYELNINSNAYQPDTTNLFNWIGGWDEDPWISPDGKLLFFHSNRDAAREDTIIAPDIYMSILLIDENGNPVNAEREENKTTISSEFMLSQNYPNPYNPSTKINYSISNSGIVILKVYDVLGKEVATLINEEKHSGNYEVEFNADNLTSGIYFYTLKAGEFVSTKKMILLKWFVCHSKRREET